MFSESKLELVRKAKLLVEKGGAAPDVIFRNTTLK